MQSTKFRISAQLTIRNESVNAKNVKNVWKNPLIDKNKPLDLRIFMSAILVYKS